MKSCGRSARGFEFVAGRIGEKPRGINVEAKAEPRGSSVGAKAEARGIVQLRCGFGETRIVDMLVGEQPPAIC